MLDDASLLFVLVAMAAGEDEKVEEEAEEGGRRGGRRGGGGGGGGLLVSFRWHLFLLSVLSVLLVSCHGEEKLLAMSDEDPNEPDVDSDGDDM